MTRTDAVDAPATPDPNGQTVSLRTARLSTTDPASRVPAPPATPLPLTRVPLRIGSYDIRREVGRGGVGIVYEGYDPRLRRPVAVKVLKDAGPADADMLRRFRTEAEAVAQLQHPHIVQVIEVGSSEGRPFVALEFLAGGSLFQRIGGRPQPPAEAAALVRTLAAATAHAHAHGVLHRDLKPGNILFTSDGTPKVTDFGSARFFDPGLAADANDPGLTRAGEVIGTPQYMAPEQARGTPDAVGPAADVYALGAILYELLTGRPPHAGVDAYDVIHAVRTRDPIAPRRLQPRLPRDLETVCLRCLEKDPKRRYGSALALADDLDRFLRGDPIRARPAGVVRKAWVAAKRRPAMAGLVVGLVLAGLTGATAFGIQFRETVAARDAAEAKKDEAETARAETERKNHEAEANLDRANWQLTRGQITGAQLLLEKSNAREAADLLDDVGRPSRGWEWEYLRARVGSLYWDHSFTQSTPALGASWALQIELSPDGTRLAVATASPYPPEPPGQSHIYDNPTAITVFRVADGSVACQIPKAFPGHIRALAWADEKTVAALEMPGRLRAWDAATGAVVTDLPPLTDPSAPERSGVAVFSPDGWVLRSAPGGALESFHSLRPGERTLHAADGFFPRCLARGGRCAVIQKHVSGGVVSQRHVDLSAGRDLSQTYAERAEPTYAPDGAGFLNVDYDANRLVLTFRSGATGDVRWERHLPVRDYGGCRFSPDGRLVVVVRPDLGELHSFDVETGETLSVSRGFVGQIHDLTFSPDGLWLATVGDDGSTRVWEVATGALAAHFRDHRGSVRRATFIDNGRRLITAGADEHVVCRDLARTKADNGLMPAHTSGGEGTRMGAIGFTAAGHLRILNTEQGGATDFDPATGNPIARRRMDGLTIRDAKELRDFVYTPDATRLAGRVAGTEDVTVWDATTGTRLRVFATTLTRFNTLAISPDGTRVAVAGARRPDPKGPFENRLLIWDVSENRLVADVKVDAPVLGLGYAPDGARLAAGYVRFAAKPGAYADVFDRDGRATGVSVPALPPDEGSQFRAYSNVIKFSPDGNTLVGTCWGTSRLLIADAATGAHLKSIPQIQAITDVAFSPDGRRLAVTGYTDVLTLYDTATWDDVTTFVCVRGRKDDWAFPGLAAFSPDGRTLTATHWDGTFTLWHIPGPDGATTGPRDLAAASAFRFHLAGARTAVARNLPHAFRFHAAALAGSPPPTEALRDDWGDLRTAVAPPRILPAVAGGIAFATGP